MFDSMKRYAGATALALTMATAPAAIGCGGAQGGDGAEAAPALASSAPRYEADSLVKGVFFGQGEVGRRIGVEDAALDANAAARIDAIVAQLRASDPAALDRFATDVQSGDVVRVREATIAMGKRLAEITKSSAAASEQAACLFIVIDYFIQVVSVPPFAMVADTPSRVKGEGLAADDWAKQLTTALAATDG